MKNLVVAVCGDQSFHKVWIEDNSSFDLFVVYYGEKENKYKHDGKYYTTGKGTKFNILADVVDNHEEIFKEYDNILVPDDDIYITSHDLNRFFAIFSAYELCLAQPSIVGWQCLLMSAHHPKYILRFTNWVEIMIPCFNQQTFQLCRQSFRENKSNWGIDYLWVKLLNYPQDKIAIIDDVVALHTRPCFYGDTYWRNKNTADSAWKEAIELGKKHQIDLNGVVEYGNVPRLHNDYDNQPSINKFFPANCEILKDLIKSLVDKRNKLFL